MEGSSIMPCFSLLCHEDQSCLNDNNVHKVDDISQQFISVTNNNNNNNTPCFDLEYENDYIKNLVKKELNFELSIPPCSFDYPSWLRVSRFDAVQWILNTKSLLEYGNQTAYLAVSYLDRFLSIIYIDEDKFWAVRLLSVACLSLAAKMEECKVASLSDYPVSEFGFDCHSTKKMELLVLSTFNWKMSLVTPFAYLQFYTKKLFDQTIEPHYLVCKAVELIMAFIQEIRLIEYRPSVIAISAVLAAVDWQMTQETLKIKVNSLSLCETSDNEQQLLSCYSLMQRLSTNGNISTPCQTEVNHTLDEIPCIVGTKRRLTFTESDHNPSLPNKIRRD